LAGMILMSQTATTAMQMTKEERRNALLWYLYAKASEQDWHAVSDVANDLRVLDAQIEKEKAQSG
jgi:hypothetical protein